MQATTETEKKTTVEDEQVATTAPPAQLKLQTLESKAQPAKGPDLQAGLNQMRDKVAGIKPNRSDPLPKPPRVPKPPRMPKPRVHRRPHHVAAQASTHSSWRRVGAEPAGQFPGDAVDLPVRQPAHPSRPLL